MNAKERRSLVFWLTLTLGLTARLGAEMANETPFPWVVFFALILAWSVSVTLDTVMRAVRASNVPGGPG